MYPVLSALAVWFVLIGGLVTPSSVLLPTAQGLQREGAPQATFPAPQDTTLVDTVAAGEVIIRALPGRIEGRTVTAYRALRIPAMGWLSDASFFWRTPREASGNYRFEFGATLSPGENRTVYVRVFVTPEDA